jgi:Short C-terminal domain
MHHTARHLFAVTALVSLLVSAPAVAAPGGMDFLFSGSMPPASERMVDGVQRIWKLGEFSALRLSAKTDASEPNDQPATLDPAALQMALLGVQFESAPGVWKPLFVAADLQDISQALVKALALATPQDEVLLMASARYDGALLGLQRSVLARLFVSQGTLNLLVKEARADLLASYRVSNTLPAYDFGNRHGASASRIMAAGATQLRPDWLALDLSGKTRNAPPVPAAAPQVTPASALAPAALPLTPAATARDKAFFEQQAQRLEGLKALLDKGLISNAEYQQKRAEILQSL